MNNKILNILNKLTDEEHQAYVVGGYVRDYLLGRETYDVDIATNMLPKDVKEKLSLASSNEDNYGSIKIKDSTFNYDITTYRVDGNYMNRKPTDYKYTMSINEDVKRRDFTINALYLDKDMNVIDLVGGQKDLENHIIRSIGDISTKLVEDPLRILRAIRFASILEFDLDPALETFIKQNKHLIATLSRNRMREELDIIFRKNSAYGINLIKKLGIEKELSIEIPNDIVFINDLYGIWAQIKFSNDYPFSSKENDLINCIKKILEYGIIDNMVLYQYGLYSSIIAGEILGTYRSFVSDIYAELPIYSVSDIDITGDEIINLLNIKPSEKIKNILHDLEINILNHDLINNKEELSDYILKNWK